MNKSHRGKEPPQEGATSNEGSLTVWPMKTERTETTKLAYCLVNLLASSFFVGKISFLTTRKK